MRVLIQMKDGVLRDRVIAIAQSVPTVIVETDHANAYKPDAIIVDGSVDRRLVSDLVYGRIVAPVIVVDGSLESLGLKESDVAVRLVLSSFVGRDLVKALNWADRCAKDICELNDSLVNQKQRMETVINQSKTRMAAMMKDDAIGLVPKVALVLLLLFGGFMAVGCAAPQSVKDASDVVLAGTKDYTGFCNAELADKLKMLEGMLEAEKAKAEPNADTVKALEAAVEKTKKYIALGAALPVGVEALGNYIKGVAPKKEEPAPAPEPGK